MNVWYRELKIMQAWKKKIKKNSFIILYLVGYSIILDLNSDHDLFFLEGNILVCFGLSVCTIV